MEEKKKKIVELVQEVYYQDSKSFRKKRIVKLRGEIKEIFYKNFLELFNRFIKYI